MLAGGDYSQHVFTRLFDFFTVNAQWQRRLWNVGLALALRELDEAVAAQPTKALSPTAVTWLANSIRGRLRDDPGVGTDTERVTLTRLLSGGIAFNGVPHRVLRQFAADIESRYLLRWEAAFRSPAANPSRERAAKAIGAHLLDAGFSQQGLHDWLRELASDAREFELADLIVEAGALLERPRETFEVLLLYETTPPGKSPRPTGWRNTRQVRKWLEAQRLDLGQLADRVHGGILIRVTSRDVYSALAEAAAIADPLAARVAVGTRKEFSALPEAFVGGMPRSLPLRRSRRVEIHSVDRHGGLYERSADAAIESALELVSHLDYGQGPVAVAGGWSAVEFLLRGPGDKAAVETADRLAALVACSWPRAELTTIAQNRMRRVDDALSGELMALETNRERCDRLVAELRAGRPLALPFRSDDAALYRISRLLGDPYRMLKDIREHAQESLRRLYRQRNLVLHGGQTRAIALEATLRTAAPLVGAGVDRIVHGHIAANTEPLQTAARAEFELHRAGTPGAPEITALLGDG